ncbi:hypothetical protein [Amnibacterium sp.]|uniref:hypothetical protein n=1 Tax=Amnibacterium sp. TaxID=1872496 RepID=UPI003F7C133B
MISVLTVGDRRVRAALLAVLVLGALLLGITAMHASMVSDGAMHGSSQMAATGHDAQASTSATVSAFSGSSPSGGSMDLMDCLLVGMVCFLTAIGIVLLAVALTRLRSVLRSRGLTRAPAISVRALRPPDPPSLLVLSICRT